MLTRMTDDLALFDLPTSPGPNPTAAWTA